MLAARERALAVYSEVLTWRVESCFHRAVPSSWPVSEWPSALGTSGDFRGSLRKTAVLRS